MSRYLKKNNRLNNEISKTICKSLNLLIKTSIINIINLNTFSLVSYLLIRMNNTAFKRIMSCRSYLKQNQNKKQNKFKYNTLNPTQQYIISIRFILNIHTILCIKYF